MLNYLGDKVAIIVRRFEYQGVLMVDAIVGNEKVTVPMSQLTDKPTVVDQTKEVYATIGEVVMDIDVLEPEVQDTEEEQEEALQIQVTKLPNDDVVGVFTQEELDKFIKSKKLNAEAVTAVLEGKQKTHKGYKFKIN